jgi:hydroxyacylglutathione hydrolase
MEKRFGPIAFIPGKNSGRYPYCHSLYLEGNVKVVIDPASDRTRLSTLRDGPGVDAVWLSHWHEDHLKHLDLFEDRALWISELDAPQLESLDAFCDAYGMTAEERDYWGPTMLDAFNFRPRSADRLIRGEEHIDLGGITIEVLSTPGHTPGHCSLYFPEQGVLFLGDYDLSPFGPWYGDVQSDMDMTVASVNRLREVPAKVWIAAHETGVFETQPGTLWDNYLAVIDQREEKLLDFLKEPRTMDHIVDAGLIYGRGRKPVEFFGFGERKLMGKHLERLVKTGGVMREGDVYRRT